jgi:hypothetical protein
MLTNGVGGSFDVLSTLILGLVSTLIAFFGAALWLGFFYLLEMMDIEKSKKDSVGTIIVSSFEFVLVYLVFFSWWWGIGVLIVIEVFRGLFPGIPSYIIMLNILNMMIGPCVIFLLFYLREQYQFRQQESEEHTDGILEE